MRWNALFVLVAAALMSGPVAAWASLPGASAEAIINGAVEPGFEAVGALGWRYPDTVDHGAPSPWSPTGSW